MSCGERVSSVDKHFLGPTSAQTLPKDKPGPVATELEKAVGGRQQGSLKKKKHGPPYNQSEGSEDSGGGGWESEEHRLLSQSLSEAGKMESHKAGAKGRAEEEKRVSRSWSISEDLL